MWRVYTSRWVNYHIFGGQPDEMVSSRCEREQRVFWVCFINWVFFCSRAEIAHCSKMRIVDAQTQQTATRSQKEASLSE